MKHKIITHPTRAKDVKFEEIYGSSEKTMHERRQRLQARRWHILRNKMTTDGMTKDAHNQITLV